MFWSCASLDVSLILVHLISIFFFSFTSGCLLAWCSGLDEGLFLIPTGPALLFFFSLFFQSRLLWFFISRLFFPQSQSLALVLIFSVCFFQSQSCALLFFFPLFFSFCGHVCCVVGTCVVCIPTVLYL